MTEAQHPHKSMCLGETVPASQHQPPTDPNPLLTPPAHHHWHSPASTWPHPGHLLVNVGMAGSSFQGFSTGTCLVGSWLLEQAGPVYTILMGSASPGGSDLPWCCGAPQPASLHLRMPPHPPSFPNQEAYLPRAVDLLILEHHTSLLHAEGGQVGGLCCKVPDPA